MNDEDDGGEDVADDDDDVGVNDGEGQCPPPRQYMPSLH